MTNFYLLNITRTNNFTDKDLGEKIGGLWQEANGKIGEQELAIYGVYHQYASNYKGDYSFSIGTEEIQTDEKLAVSDTTKFEIFEVSSGKLEDVFSVWQEIWQLEEKGKLNRLYEVDYEKYSSNGKIEIYIGVE